MRTPDGKKRCKEIAPHTGLRCTKARKHVDREIDVVHQYGTFVWRTPATQKPSRPTVFKASNVKIGGKDDLITVQGRFPSMLFDPSMMFIKPCGCSTCKTLRSMGAPAKHLGATPSYSIMDETHGFRAPITAAKRLGATPSYTATDETHSFRTPAPVDEAPANGVRDPVTATPEQQLTEWWMQQAEDEVALTVPKAIEYSAVDLMDIGHDLARTMGREIDDEEAAELGVFFYLRGKVARWVGAVIAGQRVSDDTLHDISVYCRMAQRIREVGSWPGTEKPVNIKVDDRTAGGPIDRQIMHSMCDTRCGPDCTTPGFNPDPRYPNRSAG